MNTSRTTSKRTTAKATTAEAKAKAKAEASVKATAAAIVADGLSAEASITTALTEATTPAAALAVAGQAVDYLTEAEASAFDRILFGRSTIGAAVYHAYKLATIGAGTAEAEVKAAADVTFTEAAAAAFPANASTKAAYEKLPKAKRPVRGATGQGRSWSAVAEDYAVYVNCADGRYRDAYGLSVGDDGLNVRTYLTFCRSARTAAVKAAGGKVSAQAAGALTKAVSQAAAKAEVKRQAEAKAEREAAAVKAKAEAMDHLVRHPAANVVAGLDLSVADLTACFDLDVLNTLVTRVSAWRDHVRGMTKAEREAAVKAAAPAAEATTPDAMTAEAVADVAAAPEAEAAPDTAAIIAAAVAKATAEALAAAGLSA